MSKYYDFSGPYSSVFGPEQTPYSDTFHTVTATSWYKTSEGIFFIQGKLRFPHFSTRIVVAWLFLSFFHMFTPSINLYVPNVPFLYHLNILENRKVFWCFQGVEKGCTGNKWFKFYTFYYHVLSSTDVWKMWLSNKWMVAPFSKFYGKIWVDICFKANRKSIDSS